MAFWKMAYESKWVDIAQLRLAVITEASPNGYITPEEFKLITGEDF